MLDNSPSTQVDILTYGTGAYPGVISRPASAASEIVTRAALLRDTDNNINDFSTSNCAGTIVFDGGPSGVATSWHTAANWRDTTTNLDRLPTTTDHVCIPDLGIAAVSFNSGTTSVLSITAAETVNVSAGTLNMTSASQASEFGELNFTGGTIGGTANFTVNGAMTWNDGTLTADTTTARAAINGAVSLGGTDHPLSLRQVDLNADATWTSGRILVGFGAAINNGAGHTFAVRTSADFQFAGGAAGTFNNSGAVTKSVDTTVTDIPNGIVFNNVGSVGVTTGTLDFAGGGTTTGSFNVDSGAGLAFSGATHTLSPASTLSGSGSLSFGGGTTNVNGSYSHTGPLNVSAGTANFTPPLNNNALNVTAGTLNVNSTSSVSSLTLSGTIGGSGDLTVNGPTTWTNNGFTASNTSVTTTLNGPLTMNGADHQLQIRRLVLNGATTWTATRFLIGFGGTVVNSPTGVFTATGDQDFQYWGGDVATFDNLGTFTRNGTGTTTTIPGGIVFNNSSSVAVTQGQLEVSGGGNSTGSFAVPLGSTLRFDGNTNNLNSGSTLSGPGSVTVASGTTNFNGTYTHTGPLTVSGGTANFSPALNNNELSVTGGILNLSSASSVPSLTLSGTIGGAGNLTVNGPTTWTNNGFTASNTSVTTTFNGPLTMNGADHHLAIRRLVLNGATTWTATRFLIGFGATVVNSPTGVFTATGDQDFQYWGGDVANFDNLGTFTRNGAGTTTTIPNGITFNNSSSVVVAEGQLELAGGGNSTGTFAVPAATTLRFDGGTHNLNLGSSISGAGTVRFASGTVNSVGDYNIPNLTDVTGGTVNFNLVDFADETHATAGTMTQSGGVVGGTDTLDITGSFTWSGGTQNGTGQTVILPGATMTLTGGSKTLSGLAHAAQPGHDELAGLGRLVRRRRQPLGRHDPERGGLERRRRAGHQPERRPDGVPERSGRGRQQGHDSRRTGLELERRGRRGLGGRRHRPLDPGLEPDVELHGRSVRRAWLPDSGTGAAGSGRELLRRRADHGALVDRPEHRHLSLGELGRQWRLLHVPRGLPRWHGDRERQHDGPRCLPERQHRARQHDPRSGAGRGSWERDRVPLPLREQRDSSGYPHRAPRADRQQASAAARRTTTRTRTRSRSASVTPTRSSGRATSTSRSTTTRPRSAAASTSSTERSTWPRAG